MRVHVDAFISTGRRAPFQIRALAFLSLPTYFFLFYPSFFFIDLQLCRASTAAAYVSTISPYDFRTIASDRKQSSVAAFSFQINKRLFISDLLSIRHFESL